MTTHTFDISLDDAGQRLDRYLAERLSGQSRSQVQRLIRDGLVTVGDTTERASYVLSEGEHVAVQVPESAPEPEPGRPFDLTLLYEDDSILVVDKPAGLVVHAAPGHVGATLVSMLLEYRPALGTAGLDPARPGIVHRLDKETSGVIVVAASCPALEALQSQFRRRQVDKRYLALVYGTPVPGRAAIEAPIARDANYRVRMAVVAEGRYARSEYEVIERFKDASLLSVSILTGRTHQIRVHMAAIGHPVVGDKIYGRRRQVVAAPRQMLHAQRLALSHPVSGEGMAFEAPVPADMEAVLAQLRRV